MADPEPITNIIQGTEPIGEPAPNPNTVLSPGQSVIPAPNPDVGASGTGEPAPASEITVESGADNPGADESASSNPAESELLASSEITVESGKPDTLPLTELPASPVAGNTLLTTKEEVDAFLTNFPVYEKDDAGSGFEEDEEVEEVEEVEVEEEEGEEGEDVKKKKKYRERDEEKNNKKAEKTKERTERNKGIRKRNANKKNSTENYITNLNNLKAYLGKYLEPGDKTDPPSQPLNITTKLISQQIHKSLTKLQDECAKVYNTPTDNSVKITEIKNLYTLLGQYELAKTKEVKAAEEAAAAAAKIKEAAAAAAAKENLETAAAAAAKINEEAAAAAAKENLEPAAALLKGTSVSSASPDPSLNVSVNDADTDTNKAAKKKIYDEAEKAVLNYYTTTLPLPKSTYTISLVKKDSSVTDQAKVTDTQKDDSYTSTVEIIKEGLDKNQGDFLSKYSNDLFTKIANNLSNWKKSSVDFEMIFTETITGNDIKGVVFSRNMMRNGDYLYVFQKSDKQLRLLMYIADRINHGSVSFGTSIKLPEITDEIKIIPTRIDNLLKNDGNITLIAEKFEMPKNDLIQQIETIQKQSDYFLE